jgi:hypothetical protein
VTPAATAPVAIPLLRGCLCVSIDLELSWGLSEDATSRDHARCESHERAVCSAVLERLEKYGVPATWAIVGSLIDERRSFAGRVGPRANWYAPDIVDRIRACRRVVHEVGTHTYRHAYFDALTRAEASEDLERAKEVHVRNGLPFDSLVFPGNRVRHLAAARAHGLRVFRSVERGGSGSGRQHYVARASRLLSKMTPTPAPVVSPLRHADGLVELPASLLLTARNGLRRLVVPRLFQRKIAVSLACAAREKRVFHLWFHPSNLYFDTCAQLELLDGVLEDAVRLRERGVLDVRTLGSFQNPYRPATAR